MLAVKRRESFPSAALSPQGCEMKVRFWETARISAIARLVLAGAMVVTILLEWRRGAGPVYQFLAFAFVLYLGYSIVVFQSSWRHQEWAVRLMWVTGDAALLLIVVLFARALPGVFLLFFIYFALTAGLWEGWKSAAVLSFVVSIFYLGFQGEPGQGFSVARIGWEGWVAAVGLMMAGTAVGGVAEFEHRRLTQREEVDDFASLLNFDTGWEALWQRFLSALARRYDAGRVLLAIRNPESGRINVWQSPPPQGDRTPLRPDRPPKDAAEFLLEGEWPGFCAELTGTGVWQIAACGDSAGATPSGEPVTIPERFAFEFAPQTVMSVPLSLEGDWKGRVFMLDSRGGRFHPGHWAELRRLLDSLETNITGLLAVRGAVARAVNEERDRIVRELHDGVAQTLAGAEMQLAVMGRQAVKAAPALVDDLVRLQGAFGRERDQFRRFLRDLKPLRIQPDELKDRLVAHCGQFQQETGIEVELEVQPLGGKVGEGLCREVFLLLREALHNARKHSNAGRMSVRVHQDNDRLLVSVEDDGAGFPFSGLFGHAELKAKGLAPVSLWERIDNLGGSLSIRSGRDEGASVSFEIPLS